MQKRTATSMLMFATLINNYRKEKYAMKKFSKMFIALGLTLLMALSLIACGDNPSKGSYVSSPSVSYDGYSDYEFTEEAAYGLNTSSKAVRNDSVPTSEENVMSSRKMIRDANLRMETKEFDELIPALESKINEFGGYIQASSEGGRSYRYSSTATRDASYTARIPADKLDDFLEVVGGLGNVTSKNVSVKDVTEQYVDIESRLGVLRDEESALRRILQNAEETSDLLQVQSRLYDVIEEIEANEARIRSYDSLIAFSTVQISITEVEVLTPVVEETKGEELARRFHQSLVDLGEGIVDFCINFIVALPWLLVFGIVTTAIVLAIVLPIKSKNKKRLKKIMEAKAQEQNK